MSMYGSNCLRTLFVATMALTTACATLPEMPPHRPEAALNDVESSPLAALATASVPKNRPSWSGFRLFYSGESAFNARIALVRRATHSLDVQVYHLADDETGRGFLRELRDAALRGVRVRLLVDDLHVSDDGLLAGLAAFPNTQVRLFNPLPARGGSPRSRLLRSLHEFDRVNHRMHNKLFIADNSIAITGGRNLADEYFMNNPQANFLDLDVLCVGPVVRDLSAAFDEYWNSDKSRAIESLIPKIATDERQRHFNDAVQAATTRLGERQRDVFGRPSFLRQLAAGELTLDHGDARVLVDSPAKGAERAAAQDRSTVASEVLALLASTREEALVMSPYFIPGDEGVQIVGQVTAGNPGRVKLLTNSFGATDEPLAYAGYERYRLALLKAGVGIYELSPTLARDSGRVAYFGDTIGRLHAKSLAVDRRWLFVGSLNLDPRSAHTNTEMGLVIDSPILARMVGTVFRSATNGAFRLRLGPATGDIEWVEVDWQGRETVHPNEPHDDAWLRLKLRLLQPFVSENLL